MTPSPSDAIQLDVISSDRYDGCTMVLMNRKYKLIGQYESNYLEFFLVYWFRVKFVQLRYLRIIKLHHFTAIFFSELNDIRENLRKKPCPLWHKRALYFNLLSSNSSDKKKTTKCLVMAHNPAHDLFSIGNFLCRVTTSIRPKSLVVWVTACNYKMFERGKIPTQF